MANPMTSRTSFDMNKFRLRTFVEKLIDMGEVEVHDEPVPLSELSRIAEATPKAILFRKAGPEQVELVSSVAGGRRRLAAAFGVPVDSAWNPLSPWSRLRRLRRRSIRSSFKGRMSI
jgi:3-polyprenyl-4-hydroxybenzoate decarboxylase